MPWVQKWNQRHGIKDLKSKWAEHNTRSTVPVQWKTIFSRGLQLYISFKSFGFPRQPIMALRAAWLVQAEVKEGDIELQGVSLRNLLEKYFVAPQLGLLEDTYWAEYKGFKMVLNVCFCLPICIPPSFSRFANPKCELSISYWVWLGFLFLLLGLRLVVTVTAAGLAAPEVTSVCNLPY